MSQAGGPTSSSSEGTLTECGFCGWPVLGLGRRAGFPMKVRGEGEGRLPWGCGQGGELQAAPGTHEGLTFPVLPTGHVGTSHSGGPESSLSSTVALAKFSLMTSRAQSSGVEPTLRLLCVMTARQCLQRTLPSSPQDKKRSS